MHLQLALATTKDYSSYHLVKGTLQFESTHSYGYVCVHPPSWFNRGYVGRMQSYIADTDIAINSWERVELQDDLNGTPQQRDTYGWRRRNTW